MNWLEREGRAGNVHTVIEIVAIVVMLVIFFFFV
jgi:hypothetical protein